VLEVVPMSVHQKSPLFTGSASEVDKLSEYLAAQQVKA
jgi:fructose-1,6-bisphosphatase